MCVGVVTSNYAQELTGDEKKLLEKLNNDYTADKKSASLNYAWLLYRSNGECPKADTVLNHVISLQDDDPESLTYGHWGWVWRDGEKFVDWNNALFQSHALFCDLWTQQEKMSPETQSNFISCCKRVVEAAKRRWDYEVFDIYRDFKAYSNVLPCTSRLSFWLLTVLKMPDWKKRQRRNGSGGITTFFEQGWDQNF